MVIKRARLFVSIIVLLASMSLVWIWAGYWDDPLVQASQERPLDGKHSYVILKTDMGTGSEPFWLAIVYPGESAAAATLAFRRIGESQVDLLQYVNKEIFITGRYYVGEPLALGKVPASKFAGSVSVQPVIRVENIIVAE